MIVRGPEIRLTSEVSPDEQRDDTDVDSLRINIGDVYESIVNQDVATRLYYTSSISSGNARLKQGDKVRIAEMPSQDGQTIVVEPVDTEAFEQLFVPGGVRAQPSYLGHAIVLRLSDLVTHFTFIPRTDIRW